MSKYRRPTQMMYALMVALTVWLINPVMAGGGDPEAARQAWPMIERGDLLVDVRSVEEFTEGHLEGAINIEWDQTDALAAAIGDDREREVVFYCRSGNRVGKAIKELEARGYKNIYNATGLEALLETKPGK
ncbi:MAG TPA: rhodanese-like domain-containing protein [Xanthomonadales bacterium]